jgi:hypothetical protein
MLHIIATLLRDNNLASFGVCLNILANSLIIFKIKPTPTQLRRIGIILISIPPKRNNQSIILFRINIIHRLFNVLKVFFTIRVRLEGNVLRWLGLWCEVTVVGVVEEGVRVDWHCSYGIIVVEYFLGAVARVVVQV